jgi:hypothetical protein
MLHRRFKSCSSNGSQARHLASHASRSACGGISRVPCALTDARGDSTRRAAACADEENADRVFHPARVWAKTFGAVDVCWFMMARARARGRTGERRGKVHELVC